MLNHREADEIGPEELEAAGEVFDRLALERDIRMSEQRKTIQSIHLQATALQEEIMSYTYTTESAIIEAFWNSFPDLDRTLIPDHSGKGKMYKVDTRVAFVDWVDYLDRAGLAAPELTSSVTLEV